ncbi:MAG: hypothetical protein CXZ00_06895 [Acidobacteria bacterium]|nr:MAG: hypothetical protein CXZ00_06895 [Acidobacteriota bacterium]
MRRFTVLLVCVLILGAAAFAQQAPRPLVIQKTEIFGGFAYQHADTGSGISTNLKGVAFEFSHYYANNFGFTIDVSGGWNGGVDSTGIKYSRSAYLAGPSYRLRNISFITPSVHALFGIDRSDFTVPEGEVTVHVRDTDFAAAGGVALDATLSHHFAIRVAQLDYLYTHNYSNSQSSFRYSGGIVVRF